MGYRASRINIDVFYGRVRIDEGAPRLAYLLLLWYRIDDLGIKVVTIGAAPGRRKRL